MATEIREIPLEPEGATEITEENSPEIAEENTEENKENIDPEISAEPTPAPPAPKPAPKPKAARAKGRPKGAVNKKPKPALKKPPPPEESDEELPDYVQEAVQQHPQPPTRHDVAAALFQMLQTHEHVRRNARVNKYRGWVSAFS